MGRHKKEKAGDFDRVGELVRLEKCPDCSEHPDCFSCIKGKCTALKESGGQSCTFYKPESKVTMEVRQCYQRLKDNGRDDLIKKYASALAALGVFDEEIETAEMVAGEMERFRERDLKSRIAEAETQHEKNQKTEAGDAND